MGDQIRFVDDNTDTRLAGELVDDGATVGDVLTVQADGSIAAAAGGGSMSSSWLGSYVASSTPLTDVVVATFNAPADVIRGNDLSISVDGQTITFATDGIYQITFQPNMNASSDAVGQIACSVTETTTVTDNFWNFDPSVQVPIYKVASVVPQTFPATAQAAGDTFQMVLSPSLSAGTVSLASNSLLWVTKLG